MLAWRLMAPWVRSTAHGPMKALRPKAAARGLKLAGHYLRVWKKDASGAWKIEADMATNDAQAGGH